MRKRTGHLFKRGAVYYLQYRIGGQKHVESLHTRKLRDAEAEAERIMAPLKAADQAEALRAMTARAEAAADTAAKLYDEAHPPLTLAAAWPAYLESERRPRRAGPRTLADYEGNLAMFTDWMGQHKPEAAALRDVTPEDAAAFIRHHEKAGLSGNRINKLIGFLRTFFKALEKPGRLAANPFAEIARREHDTNTKRAFTIEELKRIIETATGEMKTLFMLGTFTGLRLGDAATLRWDETDLAREIITRIPRKTARKRVPVILGIPSYMGEHLAGLPRRGPFIMPEVARRYEKDRSNLCRDIQAHLQCCGIETVLPGTGIQTVIGKDGKPVEKHTGKRAVVVAGFHSLRHSFVSLHAAAGTPQAVMQKLAGHNNPRMTELYTHLDADNARKNAAALPPIMGDPPAPKREPLPAWAVALLQTMGAKNWKEVRAELLAPAK